MSRTLQLSSAGANPDPEPLRVLDTAGQMLALPYFLPVLYARFLARSSSIVAARHVTIGTVRARIGRRGYGNYHSSR